VRPLTWQVRSASPDARAIVIAVQVHEFLRLERIDVKETPTTVQVEALGRLAPPPGGWTTYEVTEEHVVELAAPLGKRRIA
jgi:hypothetical protein